MVAPIAIIIFKNLLEEQKYTLKRLCTNTIFSLTFVLIESAIVCLISPIFKSQYGLDTKILNPLVILFYNFEGDFGVIFSLFACLYYQFPTFLLFFVFMTKSKKCIKKTCLFYSIWLLVTIILAILYPNVRG